MIQGKRSDNLKFSRSMLVLDVLSGHFISGVDKKITAVNSDLVLIPGDMTSQL